MFRFIPFMAVLALSLALAADATAASPDAPQTAASAAQTRCYEDDPCWRWSTMGNRKRGVISARSGRRVIVGPCRFTRMNARGAIDWRRTPHIRGDALARRLCPVNPCHH